MIVSGALAAGSRLGQGELADQLGISRGSVREALRRLAGDGLVEFEVNRGFFVADVGLDNVRQRLEVRLTIEPEIARLAAASPHRRRPRRHARGDRARGSGTLVRRRPRREPGVPPRRRGRHPQRRLRAPGRVALDRRRRPPSPGRAAEDADLAARRRRRAPCHRHRPRGAQRQAGLSADASARRERRAPLVAEGVDRQARRRPLSSSRARAQPGRAASTSASSRPRSTGFARRVARTCVAELPQPLRSGVAGDDDDGGGNGRSFAQPAQHLVAREVGQAEIEQHEVGPLALRQGEPFGACAGDEQPNGGEAAQHLLGQARAGRIVLDVEHGHRRDVRSRGTGSCEVRGPHGRRCPRRPVDQGGDLLGRLDDRVRVGPLLRCAGRPAAAGARSPARR